MADAEVWKYLPSPPVDSAALLAIAKPEMNAPSTNQKVRLFWFEAADSHLMLCRVIQSNGEPLSDAGCSASSWEFEHPETDWRLLPQGGGRMMFCG